LLVKRWCVDGCFSGAKNMPLFLDLFLRDSHFGNPVGQRDRVRHSTQALPLS
jgi:hypothetical protein